MITFIFKRILEAIPTLLVLITVSFFMMRLAPGNPFSSERALPPQIMHNIEEKYGLDKPMYEQYFNYLGGLLQGDFGPSFKYKDYSVNDLMRAALPVSLEIGMFAFVMALVLGIPLGMVAALKQNSKLDYALMSFAMTGVVLPSFVIAPLLVWVFAIWLKWMPAGGWSGNLAHWHYVILPVVGMGLAYVAYVARIMRGSMIEVLNSNYIRTAKAKGLSTVHILVKHALRPALLPVVSFLGPAFVGIITGSVVIETIFGLPGIGQLIINGSLNRDYSMVLGGVILIGTLTVVFNAIVDILYAMIDPKIRY